MLLACAYYPNLGHVCARTDWYVRVVGQPQSLRNPPGRWRRSPGTTRRCSRSRCRRLLGSMPVSFEAARLVDASPTERMDIRATPSGTGPAAVAGSRRRGRRSTESGAGLRSRRRCDTRLPTPSSWRERATHSTQTRRERDEITPPTRNHTGASSRSSSRPTRTRRSNASRRARMWAVLWSTSTVP